MLTLAFIGIASTAALAQSAEDETENNVTFRVLAEKTSVEPGEEIWIGVEQSIRPEWHTYWQNPGDSGSSPRHDWTLPDGFEISEIYWPVPKKIPYPPLLNYGYSDYVTLLQKLKIPSELPDGPITLSVDVEALVCKDICIPEYGSFDLVLNDPTIPSEDNSAYLAQSLEQVPEAREWDASFEGYNGDFTLKTTLAEDFLANIDQQTLDFIPQDWGLIENAATPETSIEQGIFTLTQNAGERPLDEVSTLQGILVYVDNDGNYEGVRIQANNAGNAATATEAHAPVNAPQSDNMAKMDVEATGLAKALILALLGGLVLNLMPCVFPVLSLKALSLVKTAEKDHGLARRHGIAYTLGVVLSFLAIAGVLILLQAGGQQIGWGFQLQNAIVISLLAYLLFIIGLNLAGYFEFGNSLGNVGNKLTQGGGLTSSFFTGVLATIVATPCTAPFMGVAIGYALLQSAPVALAVFAALGLGLALPYLAVAFIPAMQKALPRPGAWMDLFKQFLAFPMFGFAAWLVWILAQSKGSFAVFGILLGMLCITFALWLFKHLPANGIKRTLVIILALISMFGSLTFIYINTLAVNTGVSASEDKTYSFGEAFSIQTLKNALESNDPVFVEMTADWCITCKVNHKTSINTDSTKKVFADENVRFLIGDWTNEDAVITDYLRSFGRNGVPIYVFYGRPDANGQRPEPIVLPQILTPGIVKNAVMNGE